MIAAVKSVWDVRWTILVTVLAGVFLSSSLTDYLFHSYREWYDNTHPVVVMTGSLVDRNEFEATISVQGQKLRNCRFVSLHAYSRKNGTSTDAFKERLGLLDDASSKPTGAHDLGRYRIWPLLGADTVLMRVLHECNGRIVVTQIAEVAL